MEQVNLGYSDKNIPIPSENEYKQCLIKKTQKFLKSANWKASFALNPQEKTNKTNTYGFKSSNVPPRVKELKEFEDCMIDLVQNVKFNKNHSNKQSFQTKLGKDVHEIKTEPKLIIPADKTSNKYKLSINEYNKLLTENIQKDYRKSDKETEKVIINNEKSTATKLGLGDRMEVPPKSESYVTIKDHKPNFRNNTKCRLINPNKGDTGKVSKQILSQVNKQIKNKLKYNQWRSTSDVIDWFKDLKNNKKTSFIQFDIVEFYPSISENFLDKALTWAKLHSDLTDEQINIIKSARSTLLYSKNIPWQKKTTQTTFDVTMGSWDGAEICELVGLYLLHLLKQVDIDVGLYRDDGLAFTDKTPRQCECIKKKICKIFADNDLKITIEANTKIVDFLDVTLDLNTGLFKPFIKPNNILQYVHTQSNHPPNVIKTSQRG